MKSIFPRKIKKNCERVALNYEGHKRNPTLREHVSPNLRPPHYFDLYIYRENFKNQVFTLYIQYIGTMPRLVQIETFFFG